MTNEFKQGEIYTANGWDFCVHFVKDGWVYGVAYDAKYRYDLNTAPTEFSLRKCPVDGLLEATGATLVKE